MDAARILKLARRRVGLTQQELASRSRMPQPAISRIERGQISPTVETLERLLRACDQELESVEVASDRDLDWDQVDDHLDMSPADRARFAASAGRSMLQLLGAGRPGSTTPDRPFDPLRVLWCLSARSVDFLVIGGFAAALRGSPVVTEDIDVCHAPGRANRGRLADALVEMGARMPGGGPAAPFVIEGLLEVGEHCSFATTAGTVDTVAIPRATNGYLDLVVDADRLDIGDCSVLVPSLDDLVRMKVDGVRPQDWFALHYLRAVRKRSAVTWR